MGMMGSLYQKKDYGAAEHIHEFGYDEEFDEVNDAFSKQCEACGHVYTHDKMLFSLVFLFNPTIKCNSIMVKHLLSTIFMSHLFLAITTSKGC